MAREYTRAAFHTLVWSKPMTTLAKEFALSDVALHKICRKHSVPSPPLGWWAKKQAGKPVTVTPLPPAASDKLDRIFVAAPELRGETPAVASAREAARVRASDQPDDGGASDDLVERTIGALREARPSEAGLVATDAPDLVSCSIAPESIDRLATALQRIAAAARHQGFRLQAGGRHAQFSGEDETLDVSISEQVRRIRHVLTAKEQAEEDAWRRKRERRRKGNPWDWEFDPRPSFPEWDYVRTGLLGIELERIYVPLGSGPRKSFRDAKTQRLENMATDIGVALAVLATAKREERERRAEAERVRSAERRERERPLREAHVADRRRAGLASILAELADLARLRSLMSRLAAAPGEDPHPRLAELIDWSRAELARREAALSSDGIEDRLTRDRLFGDDDDHDFRAPFFL